MDIGRIVRFKKFRPGRSNFLMEKVLMNDVAGKYAARFKKRGLVCSVLVLLTCVLVWREASSFRMEGAFADSEIQEEIGEQDANEPSRPTIFSIPAPPVFTRMGFYTFPFGELSNLKLFENGEPMFRVDRIRDLAPQAYVHLEDRVCFVLSDDSDPRTNGRSYTFSATYYLRLRYQVLLSALILLSGVGLGLAGWNPPSGGRMVGASRKGLAQVLLESRPLVLLAAFGVPFLCFLNRNAFFYSRSAILVSLAVLLGLAAGVSLIFAGLHRLAGRLESRHPNRVSERMVLRLKLLLDTLCACTACTVFVFLFGFVIRENLSRGLPWLPTFLFYASLTSALATAATFRWGIHALNRFFLAFLVVTGGTFMWGLLREDTKEEVAFPLREDSEITLTVKPNIYLFLLESCVGGDTMRDFYGIDTEPLRRELTKREFILQDTCSSQVFTIGSAATLMMMRHLDVNKWGAGNFDVRRRVRTMLCGEAYNPVLDTLKRNGYRISFLHQNDYLGAKDSSAVDVSNLSDRMDAFQNLDPLVDATGILGRREASVWQTPKEFAEESKSIIRQTLEGPTFHFIFTGLEHNRPGETTGELRSWWKTEYRRLYHLFYPRLLAFLDFIEKEDPNALIVLIGDHGAKLFGPDLTIDSPNYPALVQSGVCNPETLARDQASVLFAIKTPVPHPVWNNRVVTHVNLFRYLFATLSGDESLLEHPEPDVSMVWTKPHIIARDGQPLQKWEPIPPELFQTPTSGDESD